MTDAHRTGAPVFAFALADERPTSLGWDRVRAHEDARGPLWVHMDRSDEASKAFVRTDAGLDPLVVDGLLDENTRPRVTRLGDGVLLTLRGVNLNPGSAQEDMISLRMWATSSRVISLRLMRLASVRATRESVERGEGARTTGALVAMHVSALATKAEDVIVAVNERMEAIEDELMDVTTPDPTRAGLAEMRQRVTTLHRYLSPQVETLEELASLDVSWLDEHDRLVIGEATNRMTRHAEDLDAASRRAVIVQDELARRLGERLGARTYVLTVVAAIMLPLTLATGLFGMNVGGVLLSLNPGGFWLVTGVMVVVAAVGAWIAHRARWL
jgi:zinc transporter